MRDDKCPSCENDISEMVTVAIVSRLTTGDDEPEVVTCPHCSAESFLTVTIGTRLSLVQP